MKPKPIKTRVTAEERATYLDTEVCRLYGFIPVGWVKDERGLTLVLRRPEPKT